MELPRIEEFEEADLLYGTSRGGPDSDEDEPSSHERDDDSGFESEHEGAPPRHSRPG